MAELSGEAEIKEEELALRLKNLDEHSNRVKILASKNDCEGLLEELNRHCLLTNIYLIGEILEVELNNAARRDSGLETLQVNTPCPVFSEKIVKEVINLTPPVFAGSEITASLPLSLDGIKGHLAGLREKALGKVSDEAIKQIQNAEWRVDGLIEHNRATQEKEGIYDLDFAR
jgi:hypothetical protein